MITEITPEQHEQLKAHADLWIKRAFRTDPIEHKPITEAIKGLYRVSKLKEPKVVLVSSPFAMAVSSTFASAIVYWFKNVVKLTGGKKATLTAIQTAIKNAVEDGLAEVTQKQVKRFGSAPSEKCLNIIRDTIDEAVEDVLEELVKGCKGRKPVDPSQLTTAEFQDSGTTTLTKFMMECLPLWYNLYQFGNAYSYWVSYLTAYRDVLGLQLPEFENFKYYEQATIHGGFRAMHEDFCIVSDFPEFIHVDENNFPHNDTGPSHRWRDGWELWHLHGVAVDKQIVMHPETQTLEQIEAEDNQEVKRLRIERFGWHRYLDESGAKNVHEQVNDRDAQRERLYELSDGQKRFVCIDPSTGRKYALGVPREITNCDEAQLWMSHGLDRLAIHRS